MEIEFDKSIVPILDSGLKQLEINLPENSREKILMHLKLLTKWNKVHNLTAIHSFKDMLIRHVFDSLSIARFIQGENVLDVGTGAGFPGIPLAVTFPDRNFVLLDSNNKKTTFLTHVVLSLRLSNVKVINSRIENFNFDQRFATIVTRATSSIKEMFMRVKHLLADNGQLLMMRGKYPEEDLDLIADEFSVVEIKVPFLDAERHIVKIIVKY